MVSILGHVQFYIIKYERRGTGTVPFPVLTNLDKRKKVAAMKTITQIIMVHICNLAHRQWVSKADSRVHKQADEKRFQVFALESVDPSINVYIIRKKHFTTIMGKQFSEDCSDIGHAQAPFKGLPFATNEQSGIYLYCIEEARNKCASAHALDIF